MDLYEIVTPSPEDAEAIGKLRAKGWLNQYSQIPGVSRNWLSGQVDRITSDATNADRANSITNPTQPGITHFWKVAKLHTGELVGVINARKLSDGQQEIRNFHVTQKHRGQGIGTELLKKAEDWFNKEEPIFVDVAVGNEPAENFYKQNGYEPTDYSYHFEELPMNRMVKK